MAPYAEFHPAWTFSHKFDSFHRAIRRLDVPRTVLIHLSISSILCNLDDEDKDRDWVLKQAFLVFTFPPVLMLARLF